MDTLENIIRDCLEKSDSRFDFWAGFLNSTKAGTMAELGVYKGDFAEHVLRHCDALENYYMVDPWRHLDDWNKPANQENDIFEEFLSETLSKTEFAKDKRILLRGTTTEVIEEIPDGELDFAYIDGDHTLKGITIDLVRMFPKIKNGGWIGGDDFSNTVWQHATTFEPTLVFPFAVFFAEAMDAQIYALPYSQFLIHKDDRTSFAFIDLTGHYGHVGLREQFHPDKLIRLKLTETFPALVQLGRRIKSLFRRY